MPDIMGIITAWDTAEITADTLALPGAPGRLAQLGLFDEQGITTSSAIIELDDTLLNLVPVRVRGGPATLRGEGDRAARGLVVPHLPVGNTILADEIQNLRAFGKTTQLAAARAHVLRRIDLCKRDLDATLEWHRVGAIRGQVLDSDGATVIYDLFDDFGLTQQTLSLDLGTSTTKVEAKAAQGLDMIEDALRLPFNGGRAFLGKDLWNSLIAHDEMRAAYLSRTRTPGEVLESFEFGGIIWERVRGTFGTTKLMADDEGYLIPKDGPPGLFVTRYAPAPYNDTTNTVGQPVYTKLEPLAHSHGIAFEVQTNPLSICTKPTACIRLTA